MTSTRLLALAMAFTLTAAACGDETATPRNLASPTDLVSPTDTERPFALAGGAAAGDDGLIAADAGNPKAGLSSDVERATEPWETNWARRTTELDGLLLGIGSLDPRDRIPPIDTPKFEPIANAIWLDDRDPGALVRLGDDVRFYPLSILTRHEIVNDRFGDVPLAITFCPLCNTALAFDRRVDGEVLRFGVSGLLRNSDLVMWDDQTTTLWQQATGEAIVGDFAGTTLEHVSTAIVSYADARASFPDALSLARDTGFGIDYGANPYSGYSSSDRPFLFDGEPDPRFPALSRVVGVTVGETRKAYPFALITEERVVNDEMEGTPIAVFWGGDTADALDSRSISHGRAIGTGLAFTRTVAGQVLTFASAGGDRFTDAETGTTWSLLGVGLKGPLAGEQLQSALHQNEFWFAWAAFFPDASVYLGGESASSTPKS